MEIIPTTVWSHNSPFVFPVSNLTSNATFHLLLMFSVKVFMNPLSPKIEKMNLSIQYLIQPVIWIHFM